MTTMTTPPWTVHEWLNTDEPLGLEHFRGRVLALEAFQMLCPGCVSHGLPQLRRIADAFPDVGVVGLHTVFEHHGVQGRTEALRAFLHEYRIDFPVAIDQADPGSRLPATMRAYEMQGTPTLVLFDAEGNRRRQFFGSVPDLMLGAEIARLERAPVAQDAVGPTRDGRATLQAGCSEDACTL